VLDRFGSHPHRNAVLGRNSKPEELAFLSEPGSSFWGRDLLKISSARIMCSVRQPAVTRQC